SVLMARGFCAADFSPARTISLHGAFCEGSVVVLQDQNLLTDFVVLAKQDLYGTLRVTRIGRHLDRFVPMIDHLVDPLPAGELPDLAAPLSSARVQFFYALDHTCPFTNGHRVGSQCGKERSLGMAARIHADARWDL